MLVDPLVSMVDSAPLLKMACLQPIAGVVEVAGMGVVPQQDSVGPIGCWPVDCLEVLLAEEAGSMAGIQ